MIKGADIDDFFDVFDDGRLRGNDYFVLVIYDISDSRRRNKLSGLLESYGVRVQKSAFECFLAKSEINDLLKSAARIIDIEQDSLRLYRLNNNDVMKTYGKTGITKEQLFILI